MDHLQDPANELIAFDLETDSAEEHIARVIGIAVSAYEDQGIYVPFYKWNKDTQTLDRIFSEEDEKDFVTELCKVLRTKKLLMHNGVFDIAVMQHYYGEDLIDALYCDTILLKHTVSEERPFGLKELGVIYFGEDANAEQRELGESIKANGGKYTKTQKDIYKGDYTLVGKYACKDVALTMAIYYKLSQTLKREGLERFFYEEEVMPLYKKATIPMKLNGVPIDINYFKNLKTELENDIIKLTEQVYELIDEDIQPKIRSILDEKIKTTRTGAFAQKLLEHYGLPVPINKKTGKPTLVKKELLTLMASYPEHVALKWLLYLPLYETIQKEVEEVETERDDDGNEVEKVVKKIVEEKVEILDPTAPQLPENIKYAIMSEIYVDRYPEFPRIFNVASTQHLSWLIFEHHKQKPKNFSRKTGAPQVDQDSIEEYKLPFIPILSSLKKTEKLLNTYVLPIIEKQYNGKIYPSMLQFGTTSGRYSCAGGLNLMTLPKEDRRIKKGFIATPGYQILGADYSALEPRCFSWVTGDKGLEEVWLNKLDLYSQIAIDVFGLNEVSADPNASNYLKTVAPEWRDKAKVFTLAVVYGANAYRIAQIMEVTIQEAQDIINRYLEAYPGLQSYMTDREEQAAITGEVATQFGRVRHLREAKELYAQYGDEIMNKMNMAIKFLPDHCLSLVFELQEARKDKTKKGKSEASALKEKILSIGREGVETYYKFKNLLNNAKNFEIQATAAHICNAAMIKVSDSFRASNIDAKILLQVHDELICSVRDDQAKKALDILRECMENNRVTKRISIPMIAEPKLAGNFADAK